MRKTYIPEMIEYKKKQHKFVFSEISIQMVTLYCPFHQLALDEVDNTVTYSQM